MGCKNQKKLTTGLRKYETPTQRQKLTPTQGEAEGTKLIAVSDAFFLWLCAWLTRQREGDENDKNMKV